MNRRAPVRSVLAERRMFANGGMLPISKPMQNNMNQPAGILASSQPLIEAVAQDAVNPMGGGTLSMAQGGVVGFQQGGVGLWPLESPPSLGEREVRFLEAQTQRELEKNAALGELNERGAAPGLTAEVVNLAGTDPGMPFGPIRLIAEAPKDLTVAEQLKRRLPDPAYKPGVRASELGSITIGDRRIFANTLADALSVRTGLLGKLKTFENTIVEDFLSKYDEVNLSGPEKEKRALERREASAKKLGFASYEALQAQKRELENIPLSSWLGAVNADERTMDYFSNPDNIPKNLRRYFATATTTPKEPPRPSVETRPQITSSNELANLPTAPTEKTAEEPPAPPAGTTPAPTGTAEGPPAPPAGTTPAPTGIDGPIPTEAQFTAGQVVNPGSNAFANFPLTDGRTDADPTPTGKTITKRATDETLREIADAAENRNVDRDMDFFKNRFIDSVGEYQGKTESEKGMDFIKLGMAIASGKSPNAISNISNGVLATIDTFSVDDKQKRAFERQVNLSAAQYALSAIAKDEAQLEADRRKGFFFYDQDKKSKDKPFGELVRVSMADILANDGKIPDNLIEKELILKNIASVKATGAALNKQILENAELYRIDRVEAKEIKDNLSKYENAFISGEVGISLLNSVLADVAAGDITGFGSAGLELIGKAYKAAGLDPSKKYTKIEDAKADIGRVLQLLIPISLGKSQTANSISNRDVELLANAYIDSVFLDKNGVLGFTTTGKDALGNKLVGAMKVFRDKQLEALAGFDDVINRLNTSNQRILSAQTLGIPVDPGPFGRDYFKQTLSRVSPLAEQTRGLAQESDQAAVQPRLWSYDFDPETNKFRYKGAEGTTFAGQFFEPTKENLSKLVVAPKE